MKKEFDYIKEASLTNSSSFYGEQMPLSYFEEVVSESIEVIKKLDQIKKALFYGREIEIPHEHQNSTNIAHLPQWISNNKNNDVKAIDVIHGIIGKVTEAGELLEALAATAFECKPFDAINMVEEVGDGLWYDALLLNTLCLTFEEAQQINIEKLRKRYPNKFTEFDAIYRNVDEERKILNKMKNNVDTAE